jgi:hypothetical protein
MVTIPLVPFQCNPEGEKSVKRAYCPLHKKLLLLLSGKGDRG